MATSSTSAHFLFPNVAHLETIKFDGSNYLSWLSLIVPILRSYDLMGIVDGSDPCPPKLLPSTSDINPAYSLWVKKDQFILSWLNASLSESVLSTLYGLHTSHEVWRALELKFASDSRSRITQLKCQLQTLHQGSKSCTDFINLAKSFAAQLAATGRPIDDDDLVSYIIGGLNPPFNPFITSYSFASRESSLSLADFTVELLSFELLLDNQHQQKFALPKPSNFAAPKPFHNPNPSPTPRSPYQICSKSGHRALDCYHRMDYAYQGRHPPAQLAAMIAQSNSFSNDDTWFADSGANAHLTPKLENLSLHEPYKGNENITVGNGTGLAIHNIGSLTLHTSHTPFKLSHVLHCPSASANLLSINQFCKDNSYFFILTDSSFYVKDKHTGRILLQGRSKDGLYPINQNKINKSSLLTAMFGVKAPVNVWYSRLGHASFSTVSPIVSNHHLPLLGSSSTTEVCASCQLGKSKQLPFKSSV
ncbi:hypothetical protein F2P56_014809 [Juglans regia]|uniref:GAG-pre-integrase domain-containing protein n=1 Tax=Juglans regia TaxID=51240 RepID=A0A833XEE3_JUGRE|nr:hypothetical protein F2P56_014809 [Juglans regia]